MIWNALGFLGLPKGKDVEELFSQQGKSDEQNFDSEDRREKVKFFLFPELRLSLKGSSQHVHSVGLGSTEIVQWPLSDLQIMLRAV